jgi:hypothetical protein
MEDIFHIIAFLSGILLGIGIILIPTNYRIEEMQITIEEQQKTIAKLCRTKREDD